MVRSEEGLKLTLEPRQLWSGRERLLASESFPSCSTWREESVTCTSAYRV